MSDYTGKKCLSCGEEFAAGNDIVVCPDCGTPYHRECYLKNGRCVNDALHTKNGSWLHEQEIIDKTVCRICGEHNPPDAAQCSRCGRSLSLTGTTMGMNTANGEPVTPPPLQVRLGDRLCGLNPDEEFDGVKVSEIADFVGANSYYYLPIFNRMKKSGKKLSFNFSSLIFSVYFYATRKMRGISYISVFIFALVSLPAMFINLNEAKPSLFRTVIELQESHPNAFMYVYLACSALHYALLLILCLYANWFYYRHTIKSIKAIKSASASAEECAEKIRLAGGVSYRAMLPLLVFRVAVTFALLFGANLITTSL